MQQSALYAHPESTSLPQTRTSMQSLLLRAGLLALFLTLITHPALTARCAAKGLTTWYTSIVPILLPSMILAGLLIRTKACELLHPLVAPVFQRLFALSAEAADAFLVGILCGYPSGAMVTGELYREGRLTDKEARRLLLFCNYPSPMFLTGIVLHTALHDELSILPVLLPVYVGGVLTGMLSRPRRSSTSHKCAVSLQISGAFSRKHRHPKTLFPQKIQTQDVWSRTSKTFSSNAGTECRINHVITNPPQKHLHSTTADVSSVNDSPPQNHLLIVASPDSHQFNHLLERSLMTAARTILIVGLYIMLFQIFSGLAMEYLHMPPLLLTILTGTLEMTNGTLLSAALPLPLTSRLTLILGIAAFGGISTWLQVLTVLGEEAHLAKEYLKGRALHCVLTVGICLVMKISHFI